MSIVIDLGDLFPYNGADKILAGKFYLHGVPANRALALKPELKKILPYSKVFSYIHFAFYDYTDAYC